MKKEEFYRRMEKIKHRRWTDRVSADEDYNLTCQENYLMNKYIENLEQQVKSQCFETYLSVCITQTFLSNVKHIYIDKYCEAIKEIAMDYEKYDNKDKSLLDSINDYIDKNKDYIKNKISTSVELESGEK